VAHILLTGSTGFLGNIVLSTLKASGLHIQSLGSYGRIDISKPFKLPEFESLDTLVHCAGKAHIVPKSQEEIDAFYSINYEGTINLCRALVEANQIPKSFVFISTVAVYGLEKGEGIDENAPLLGESPYAKSKILAELFLKDWALKHQVTLTILRLPLIAGPNPPGNLGAMIKGIQSGKYLSIGKANARKSMVWAEDVALIIPKAALIGGVFNLTDGHHPTFGELEFAIATHLKKSNPIRVSYTFARSLAWFGDLIGGRFPINSGKLEKILSTLTFDDGKAQKLLNWQPRSVISQVKHIT
jgi:nucleoside-diphosphate-sugar epimerase